MRKKLKKASFIVLIFSAVLLLATACRRSRVEVNAEPSLFAPKKISGIVGSIRVFKDSNEFDFGRFNVSFLDGVRRRPIEFNGLPKGKIITGRKYTFYYHVADAASMNAHLVDFREVLDSAVLIK
jgi:hypothetical protein